MKCGKSCGSTGWDVRRSCSKLAFIVFN